MINPGTVLQGRYRIERQIGQGGMGAVYIARDERFGSTVAVKETFFSDNSLTKAFEREARLLNNLRHPALPRVSDHFIDAENGQFLVMEYIAGEDLSEMMEKKHGAFPVEEVVNWADQLLDALDYLHTQEVPVIHRDIKPQNLKLTPRGQIILLDFGLAKGNPTDAQHQTAAKSVFGYSRSYASLEQIQGTGTDPRSDLYALAATLYHLLTGTAPVDALTRAMQVLNGNPDSLIPANKKDQNIPYGLAKFLSLSMALNANNRPTSALEMRSMLKECLTKTEPVDFKTRPAAMADTGLLDQNTQVFGETQPSGGMRQADINTEILGGAISGDVAEARQTHASAASIGTDRSELETAIKEGRGQIRIPVSQAGSTGVQPAPVNTQTGTSKRGFALGATALGGLLLLGGGASAFYFFGPGGAISSSPSANAPVDKVVANTVPSSAPVANLAVTNTDVSNGNESSENTKIVVVDEPKPLATPKDAQGKDEQPTLPGTQSKQQESVKSDVKPAVPKSSPAVTERKVVVVAPPDVSVPDTLDVPEPGDQSLPPKPNAPKPPFLTQEQLRSMTPEQRRKFRIAMERYRKAMQRVENLKTPTPQPKQD